MERNFVLHTKGGTKVITEKEAIENALLQERKGIKPIYSFWDSKKKIKITPAGWLVWSTFLDGAGVVYRRKDGKMILITGWQGDFCC